jgi:hypothetical protein
MKKQRPKKLALMRETLTLLNVRGLGTDQCASGGGDCVTTTWQDTCDPRTCSCYAD